MPDPLHPAVYQGLGWSPAADPSQPPMVPPPPGADQWGGLHPSVVQGLGWSPPDAPADQAPLEAPTLPPTPQQLPSTIGAPAPTGAPPGGPPDHSIPESAFGGAATAHAGPAAQPGAPAKPTAAKPLSFDQQLSNLQQREQGTEAAQTGAIQAGVEAGKQLHADQLQAYGKAQQTVEANAAERQRMAENRDKAYATNSAQIDADKKAIDNHKYNHNKFMDQMGVGDHIRWGIGQVLAGIGQGMQRQGGPNPVTQMLQQKIHESNEAQMHQRDALVQKLGFDKDSRLEAKDYFATRQAEIDKKDGLAYTALGKQLEEAALKSADPIAQANGLKEAANVRAMGDERLKSYIHLKSDHDAKQAEIGLGYGRLGEEKRHNLVQEGWQETKFREEQELKAAALLMKKQGKLTDEETKTAVAGPAGPNGELQILRDKNGEVHRFRDPTIAQKQSDMVAAATSYNRLVGQMARGIQDHGGESGWLKGGEWQKMQSDLQSATAELHDAYGITAFREPTVKFFEKMASAGVDPTSFVRDASAALKESNANLQAKVNEKLGAAGYDGAPLRWADSTNPPEPRKTIADMTLEDVLHGSRNAQITEGDLPALDGRTSESQRASTAQIGAQRRVAAGNRHQIDVWGAMAKSEDPQAQRLGRAALQSVADKGQDDADRQYAAFLLQEDPMPKEPIRGASGAPR